MNGVEVRLLRQDDAPAMRRLFEDVFKQPMSAEFWSWKYGSGEVCAIGAFKDGELVAHYGGVGADISYLGQPARAVQIVDVMVKTAARQAVRKQSPFFRAGTAFLERFIGYENPYLLGYGFPSDRHMLLAGHLGIYAPVGRMCELSWTLERNMPRPGLLLKLNRVTAANIDQHAAALDKLGARQRRDLSAGIVVKKDSAFVHRRYLRNPDREYQLWLATSWLSGRPAFLLVLKQEAERVLLMDYLGGLQGLPGGLRLARFLASKMQGSSLASWCSEAYAERFMIDGAKRTALPITTPANIWTKGPAPEDLRDRWWLMAGDTDFL